MRHIEWEWSLLFKGSTEMKNACFKDSMTNPALMISRLNSPDMFLLTCKGHMHVIPFVGKRVKIVSRERDVGSPQESKNLHWDLLAVGFYRDWALLIVHALCQGLFIKWDSFSWDKALTTRPEPCDMSPVHPYSPNTSDIPPSLQQILDKWLSQIRQRAQLLELLSSSRASTSTKRTWFSSVRLVSSLCHTVQ